MRILIFLLILLYSHNTGNINNELKDIKHVLNKIDTKNCKLKFRFNYKNIKEGYTPDVHMSGTRNNLILSEISKSDVIELTKQYASLHKTEDKKLIRNISKFLKFNKYSVQFEYKEVKASVKSVICLIYHNNNQYILFYIDCL